MDQPSLASAHEEPQAMATFRGTARSKAPVNASSREGGHFIGLIRFHVQEDLVVNLEDQVRSKPTLLEPRVKADQSHLEQVSGQALDSGVHGLALGRLTDLIVRRDQIG